MPNFCQTSFEKKFFICIAIICKKTIYNFVKCKGGKIFWKSSIFRYDYERMNTVKFRLEYKNMNVHFVKLNCTK